MVTLFATVSKVAFALMPEVKSLNRQQRIGGILGVALLAFALGYRFLPGIVHEQTQQQPEAQSLSELQRATPMGFDRPARSGSVAAHLQAVAGPPVSLASSDVIMAYRRAANAPVSEQLQTWLRHGDKAAVAGNLAGSDGSATSWYAKVLEADKDNRAARAGLAEVSRKLASRAHRALIDGDEDAARKVLDLLQDVPLAQAEAARLKEQLRIHSRITPMLAQAADLLKGQTVSASRRDQALQLYREVLKLDPGNAVADQGMLKIQRIWLDKALAAVAQSDYATADHALAEAAGVLPSSQELQNVRSRVEHMRRLQASNILAQAHTALDSGDLPLARKLADQAGSISADLPGMESFNDDFQNARLYGGYKPGQSLDDRFVDRAGQAPRMVVLPIGQFMMGSAENERDGLDSERPRHEVTISQGIAMSRTEITVGQFREFINASGYRTDAQRAGNASVYDEKTGRMHAVRGADWTRNYAGDHARGRDPVVNVSFNDAHAYAQWLSDRTGHAYRLPSEAEFEYALRAGTRSRYWWGDGTPAKVVENVTGTRDRAPNGRRWIRAFADYGDGYWGPAPAGHFRPNPFGLYDMSGNVSEWVEDCWHDNYTRAPRDGSAWINPGCTSRVVRGGSWGSAPEQVRSAYRIGAAANVRSGRVGFRVVRDLTIGRVQTK